MVAMLDFAIFAGALAASIAVIVMMVAPQWQRIVKLAAGQVEPAFAPLATLAVAERRIARRGSAGRMPHNATAWREAA